jgi:tetratricopeptide (TPR) repeat protein
MIAALRFSPVPRHAAIALLAGLLTFSGCAADDASPVAEAREAIEASLLAGDYATALAGYTAIDARLLATHPDAYDEILGYYEDALASAPEDRRLLVGQSFALWWVSEYEAALAPLAVLLTLDPDDPYAVLFRGSTRLFVGTDVAGGTSDLTRALTLDAANPHAHFVVADAYTYALPDLALALAEAETALSQGLDTPRLQAILATAYLDMGDAQLAGQHFAQHIDLGTTELVDAQPLPPGATLTLSIVPGRTFELTLELMADVSVTVTTASPVDEVDSILVVRGPDGEPVFGNDDFVGYDAGFMFTPTASGTYRLLITSFEGAGTGALEVSRGAD